MDYSIPKEVTRVTDALQQAGFEAYLVGGCVRDLLQGKKPKDWDVTTNAKPEQIQAHFHHAFYENDFGTVGVVNEDTDDSSLQVIEVTTYRKEAKYSDSRHPDAVSFSETLAEDLKRRDFTVNSIALDPKNKRTIDPFKGQDDLKKKIIRAVGIPEERFEEDVLRIMRAARLATELDFKISHETAESIKKLSKNLQKIAIERTRDEFLRIVSSETPMRGINLLHKLNILQHVIPEFENGIGVEQNQAHKYDVWGHNLRTLQHAARKNWSIDVRLSALFHDIAKPNTRRWSSEKNDWTFYGHDVVGAKVTREIMRRLKFPTKTTEKVSKLVRWHMFFSDPEKITLSAVRRLVRNVGPENIWDLMKLRACDRIGTGRPKEQPYRLRKYKAMVEEALRAPISVKMLEINGDEIMEKLHMKPGVRVGYMLHALLEETLENPAKNNKEFLMKRISELDALPERELKSLGEAGKRRREAEDVAGVKFIRDRYWVK